MWGSRKGDGGWSLGRIGAFLDQNSEIEGKYTCSGTVMLDAKIKGEITSRDTLIIGAQGSVHATVRGVNVVVRGELVGRITATERVELKAGARVTGDIEAPVIVVEEGAVLDGHCRMGKGRAADGPLSLVVPMKA
jgi:cytoskeletal protein CcmA (bactofilin family)